MTDKLYIYTYLTYVRRSSPLLPSPLSPSSLFAMSVENKRDYGNEKVSDNGAESYVVDGDAASEQLHRTMKNRHIAMIRFVSSVGICCGQSSTEPSVQYWWCYWYRSFPRNCFVVAGWWTSRSAAWLCCCWYHLLYYVSWSPSRHRDLSHMKSHRFQDDFTGGDDRLSPTSWWSNHVGGTFRGPGLGFHSWLDILCVGVIGRCGLHAQVLIITLVGRAQLDHRSSSGVERFVGADSLLVCICL